ncbi:MAG: DNA polymerase Y family protein [Patescibacteria group bacterium]
MDRQVNQAAPRIMHIDLNSCFATVSQQAHPHLRGKPLVIAAYTTDRGCILASSIEAKKLGIKTGMMVYQARTICPEVIVRENDPDLVRDVSSNFMKICGDYSPDVTPKSIDEIVINFAATGGYHKKTLVEIGREIKDRFHREIGEWIFCNIGISTNRFLAKLASSLHKPDGLDVIDHRNLMSIYSSVKLTDLNGINVRYEARLNRVGIFNPTQFFYATDAALRKQVFGGIVGHYWYMRLRGWEVDDFKSERKSYGQEYSLGKKTNDPQRLAALIMMLTEKMGRRLRSSNRAAKGVHLAFLYDDWSYWHRGRKFDQSMYTTQELYQKIMGLSAECRSTRIVRKIAVSCFGLTTFDSITPSLFDDESEKMRRVSNAVDLINDRYGEYVVTPAIMIKAKKTIVDRIAFGGL